MICNYSSDLSTPTPPAADVLVDYSMSLPFKKLQAEPRCFLKFLTLLCSGFQRTTLPPSKFLRLSPKKGDTERNITIRKMHFRFTPNWRGFSKTT